VELPDGYTYTSTGEVAGDRLPSLIQPLLVAAEDAVAVAGRPTSRAKKASNMITRRGAIRAFT
jgi:hypothetical protein